MRKAELLKLKKPFFAIIILASVSLAIYVWLLQASKEWETNKVCAECTAVEDGEMQRLIGRIEVQPNNKMLFSDMETGKVYNLIPCDVNCNNYLSQWFKKIGFVDSYNEPIYFDIEGKLDAPKKEFLLLNVLLIDTERATGKLIAIEGENKISWAKFKVIDSQNTSLNKDDIVTLGYYNSKKPNADIDTAILAFIKTYTETRKNHYICPDYDGQKGIRKISIHKK